MTRSRYSGSAAPANMHMENSDNVIHNEIAMVLDLILMWASFPMEFFPYNF